MSLPLPPDDPRQVRALREADRVRSPQVSTKDLLAAYFSALQTEGVVLVAVPPCPECKGTGNDDTGLSYSPPPCPRCNGSGLARMVLLDDVEADIERAAVLLGCFAAGAGRDDVRREAHLVSDRLSVALRRFSGTGEEPHG